MSDSNANVEDALREFRTETNVKLNKEDAGIITAIISEYAMGLADQGRALLHVNDVRGAKACADQLMRLHAICIGIKDGEYTSDTFDEEILRKRFMAKRENNLHIMEVAERMSRGDYTTKDDGDGEEDREPQPKARLH